MPQVNTDTITSHIEFMMRPYAWGIHTQVIAAASLLQVPVYFIEESDAVQHGEYHWQVICLLPSEKLHYPEMVDPLPIGSAPLTHFELVYTRGTHYDSMVSSNTGKPCLQFPVLTDKLIDMTNVVL